MSWINYNQLLYFRQIAKSGSIAQAAKELYISPPALSMQLKAWEDFVGAELFDRQGRRLVLNEFGANVLDYAEKINQLGGELAYLINNTRLKDRCSIKIGTSDGLPKSFIREVTIKVLKQFENAQILIHEGKPEELLARLGSREYDIIFTNQPVANMDGNYLCQKVQDDQVSIFGSEKFKKLQKNFPQSLEGAPFILPTLHSELRNSLDYWFMKNKVHYRLIVEGEDSAVKKKLAIAGVGLVALPNFSAREYVDSKQLEWIGALDGMNENYFLTVRKERHIKNDILEYIVHDLWR